nr:hypothetical protein CFP56_64990 [Quercus suber]
MSGIPTALVNALVPAPDNPHVNTQFHTLGLNPLHTSIPTPLVTPIPTSDSPSSISQPTPIPPVCPIAPPVTSMFQIPFVTNTHSMVTRSKVGIFKLKALVAQACTAVPQTVVQPTKLSKPSKVPKPDYTLTEPPTYKVAVQYPQCHLGGIVYAIAFLDDAIAKDMEGNFGVSKYHSGCHC